MPDYLNELELLKDALLCERRIIVEDWARIARPVDAPEAGEKIQSIQASLKALEAIIEDQKKLRSIRTSSVNEILIKPHTNAQNPRAPYHKNSIAKTFLLKVGTPREAL